MPGALGLLVLAIGSEVFSSALLSRTNAFRNPGWTALVLAGYTLSIWLLALVVKHIPMSVTYAVWSGLGTAAIAIVGVAWMGERLDVFKITALLLIIGGVVMLNLQSAG